MDSHESRSGALITLDVIFTVLIVLTAGLRLLAKRAAAAKIGIDDYFITVTTMVNVIANGLDIKACTSGFGRHFQTLTFEEQVEALKYGQLAVGLAGIAYCLARLSICLFILQIVRGTHHRRFRILIYMLIGLIIVISVIVLLLWALQARPLAKAWDPRIPGTRNPKFVLDSTYFSYASNIFINAFYSLSPIYILWNVKMDGRKRIIVCTLMGSASLIIVISCLNIAYAKNFLNDTDPTWALVNEFICDIIERNFTVIIANLPGVSLLATRLLERYKKHGGCSLTCISNTDTTGEQRRNSLASSESLSRSTSITKPRPTRQWNGTSWDFTKENWCYHVESRPSRDPTEISSQLRTDDENIHVQTDVVFSEELEEEESSAKIDGSHASSMA